MAETRVISDSGAIDLGYAIHKRVVAEGGYMVHLEGKSFFEWYDRKNGVFSRSFSPALMDLIRKYREKLRVYAAWRRDCLGHEPPGSGSSGTPFKAGAEPRRSAFVGVQRESECHVMHEFPPNGPGGMGGVGGADVPDTESNGGFRAIFAPHGATEKREGGRP